MSVLNPHCDGNEMENGFTLNFDELIAKHKEMKQDFKTHSFEDFQLMGKDEIQDLNIMYLYSIYDVVAGLFGNVFINSRKELVIRDLKNIMTKDTSHTYNQNSDKFHLVSLGTFDVTTGIIEVDKRYICSLDDIKKQCENTL